MKTLFIASGPYSWGSARMRCYWPARFMDADVSEPQNGEMISAADYEAIVFQKHANPVKCMELVKQGKRVYWDVCDPTWWWHPDESRVIADEVTGVVASSEALAADFNAWYGSEKATCIPDCLDLSAFPKQRQHENANPVRFIWYGVAVNRIGLFAGLANLERLACNGYPVELTIFDNRPDEVFLATKEFPVYHVLWDVDKENEILAAHDVAFLPPYPGPWGKVKSNNKRLTAYASGLPVDDGLTYKNMVGMMNPEARATAASLGLELTKARGTAQLAAQYWKELTDV